MAFFRSVSFTEQLPAIVGERVMLRAPQMADFAEWAALREASRDFLTPWEPTWPADDLTRASFRRRIKRYSEDQRSDLAYPFFIFRKTDNVLVGGLTLANIRRGCAQAGSLGYWMGAPYAGQGYMTAAVAAVLPFAFGTLRLHRVEAACIPGQYRVDPAAGKDRLSARGLCPAISLHQRGLAGSPVVCPAAGRPAALTKPGRPWGCHGCPAIRPPHEGDCLPF